MRLEGKVALITGSGTGQGRAACQQFAREGAGIVAMDVDKENGEITADLVKAAGGNLLFIHGDVGVEEEVKRAVAAGVGAFGKLNILYNNAGVMWRDRDFEVTRTDEEIWDRVMDINLKGYVWVAKYGIPELINQGGGSIINISSISALLGFKRAQDAYTCTKGAIISLTRSQAIVYADKNIRANVIHPGMIDTPLQKALDEDAKKTIASEIPLGRLGQAEDVVNCAVFLASDEACYITGSEIVVDGGIMVNGG